MAKANRTVGDSCTSIVKLCRVQGGAGPACSVLLNKQDGPVAAPGRPDAGQARPKTAQAHSSEDTLTCAPAPLNGDSSPPQQQACAGLNAPAHPRCPPAGLDPDSGRDGHQALLHIAFAKLTVCPPQDAPHFAAGQVVLHTTGSANSGLPMKEGRCHSTSKGSKGSKIPGCTSSQG